MELGSASVYPKTDGAAEDSPGLYRKRGPDSNPFDPRFSAEDDAGLQRITPIVGYPLHLVNLAKNAIQKL